MACLDCTLSCGWTEVSFAPPALVTPERRDMTSDESESIGGVEDKIVDLQASVRREKERHAS
jgi:hypothetical protein